MGPTMLARAIVRRTTWPAYLAVCAGFVIAQLVVLPQATAVTSIAQQPLLDMHLRGATAEQARSLLSALGVGLPSLPGFLVCFTAYAHLACLTCMRLYAQDYKVSASCRP